MPEQIKKGTAVLALQAAVSTANAGDLSLDIKSHLWTDSFSRSHFRVNHGTSTVVNIVYKRKGTINVELLDVPLSRLTSTIIAFCPHPYRVRSENDGFSHGLKTRPRRVFLTAFRIPHAHQKTTPSNRMVSFFGGECGIRTHGPLRDHRFSRPAR